MLVNIQKLIQENQEQFLAGWHDFFDVAESRYKCQLCKEHPKVSLGLGFKNTTFIRFLSQISNAPRICLATGSRDQVMSVHC
jgi:hypothetical protein